MNKEIRELDIDRRILRVTTCDERWYARKIADTVTGLPRYQYVPSVTWICGHYPKGVAFHKWLASTGWDESKAIKEAAGDKGSKVHAAIADLIDGKTVAMDAEYVNPSTGLPEPLSLEEYECLMGFVGFCVEKKPVTVARDVFVWNELYDYAGMLDYLCRIDGEPWLIDFKTSQSVWPEHEIQVSAYKAALPKLLERDGEEPVNLEMFSGATLGILQVGYRRNKQRWKLTPVEDQFPLFLSTRNVWAKETEGQEPHQRDYPLALTLPTQGAPR